MSLITCYRKKVWLCDNTLSQNQPKWSLWGFSVLRHPNHLVLVGVNRRNVINTQQFYAAPDQANWEFFWHTDCMLQLQVHTFLQNTRELPGCLLEISPSGRKSLRGEILMSESRVRWRNGKLRQLNGRFHISSSSSYFGWPFTGGSTTWSYSTKSPVLRRCASRETPWSSRFTSV